MWVKVKVLVTQLCLTLWNPMDSTHQAPVSKEFSRQEYWSTLPFRSPGDRPNLGIEPRFPALQADSLPTEPLGNPKERQYKECSNYCTIALFSHASKVRPKLLQARFTWTKNFQMIKLGLEKAEETQRSNCQHPLNHRKSKRVPEKHLLLLYWLC